MFLEITRNSTGYTLMYVSDLLFPRSMQFIGYIEVRMTVYEWIIDFEIRGIHRVE